MLFLSIHGPYINVVYFFECIVELCQFVIEYALKTVIRMNGGRKRKIRRRRDQHNNTLIHKHIVRKLQKAVAAALYHFIDSIALKISNPVFVVVVLLLLLLHVSLPNFVCLFCVCMHACIYVY